MHLTSELVLRHVHELQSAKVLLLNPPRDALAAELVRAGADSVKAFTQDFGDQQYLAAAGIESGFGLLPNGDSLPEHIILFLPREKDRLEFLLHFLSAHMAEDALLWLVGENKAGVKSAESRLKQRFSRVRKRDAARHCVLYQAKQPASEDHRSEPRSQPEENKSAARLPPTAKGSRRSEPRSRPEENKSAAWLPPTAEGNRRSEPCSQPEENKSAAWLPPTSEGNRRSEPRSRPDQPSPNLSRGNTSFSLDSYRQEWTLPTNLGDLKMVSLPGSFAHGRLDKGTALLLDFLQSTAAESLKIQGRVIDFGCGVGVIGLFLKQRNPAIELEMLDTSASALESTRLSLQANGFEAKVVAANGLESIGGRCNWIISNPPFHSGIATDLEIAQQMVARAPVLLGNRGRMLLVCNRHLPYEGWLEKSFARQEKVAENREFKVLLAYASHAR